jgi:hypothetical protein
VAETLKYITNNTGHIIVLPAIAGNGKYPDGFRLIPGLNRIPAGYLEAAAARSQPVCDEYGKPVTRPTKRTREVVVKNKGGDETVQKLEEVVDEVVLRFPLKVAIDRLFSEQVRIVTSQGKTIGARLTLHKDGEIQDGEVLGAKPPLDLPGTDSAAMFMVNNCSDRDSLVRWGAEDMREKIRHACGMRLGMLQ